MSSEIACERNRESLRKPRCPCRNSGEATQHPAGLRGACPQGPEPPLWLCFVCVKDGNGLRGFRGLIWEERRGGERKSGPERFKFRDILIFPHSQSILSLGTALDP